MVLGRQNRKTLRAHLPVPECQVVRSRIQRPPAEELYGDAADRSQIRGLALWAARAQPRFRPPLPLLLRLLLGHVTWA